MSLVEVPFLRATARESCLPERLASAYLAALGAAVGEAPIAGPPRVERTGEPDAEREVHEWTGPRRALRAESSGIMSGHGRHGTGAQWTFRGLPPGLELTGESLVCPLLASWARLDLRGDPTACERAAAAFRTALADLDGERAPDGPAILALERALAIWRTADLFQAHPEDRRAVEGHLRFAMESAAPEGPSGREARYLLARLLLLEGDAAGARALLEPLAAVGPGLSFVHGIAAGLSPDGTLWFVYQPYETLPPLPHQEALLALAGAAERLGERNQAVGLYRQVVELGRNCVYGSMDPHDEATKQLERLGA